jgi:Family of unknown function (DUF6338)
MLVTGAQVADTITYLIPGFLLLKMFYAFGLRTKRTDAQWVIWSIVASVPLNAAVSAFRISPQLISFLVTGSLAVLSGYALALCWRWLLRKRPSLRLLGSIRAWDTVLNRPQWVQIELDDGTMYMGAPSEFATSSETDDLDVYIEKPRRVDGQELVELPGVEGVLLERKHIRSVWLYGEQPPDPASGRETA